MRTLTYYLPQFHTIPENDKWWGKGFTEWETVRNAKPLFEEHRQPRKPLKGNYYNLLDKETMQWQADLMKKYGIDGQCFYHYYFEDGKKLLEKPAENLLKWTDIDMPFCFDWANENWIRTWSNILGGNVWADVVEKTENDNIDGILMEQKFGRKKEWKQHFEYLLPFFRDPRYIKHEGKPVFLFHTPDEIPCMHQMIEYWRELASQTELGDIYFIGVNVTRTNNGLDAVLYNAPHAFWKIEKKDGLNVMNYSQMWENLLHTEALQDTTTYFSGMPDVDNSPRKGRKGVITQGVSVDIFREGMTQLYRKSKELGNEFVFINAWNEWGEGMYLEPDEENGYAYLEAVEQAQVEADKETFNIKTEDMKPFKLPEFWQQKRLKCLNRWLDKKEEGKRIEKYLNKYGINSVAIYGMGLLGKHLIKELQNSNIEIKCIIDKDDLLNHPKYKIVKPDSYNNEGDALIITAIKEYDNIYDMMKKQFDKEIFSMEEIIFEM